MSAYCPEAKYGPSTQATLGNSPSEERKKKKQMMCNRCEKPLQPGETVMIEQFGEIVDDKFMATEEPSVHHEDCGDF